MKDLKKEFGKHYLVEFKGCNADKLKYVAEVKEAILKAAEKSEATILEHHFHQFEPFGVSGIIFIAESHFAIYTWPEDNYAGLDILTCGSMYPERAIDALKEAMEANEVDTQVIPRGI